MYFTTPESDHLAPQHQIAQTCTKEEINALAKKYLPVEKRSIMLVGDKASIKPGLAKLGYETMEPEPEPGGAPVMVKAVFRLPRR